MGNDELTREDINEWCRDHTCDRCRYMSGYCHITEHLTDQCFSCTNDTCGNCSLHDRKRQKDDAPGPAHADTLQNGTGMTSGNR